MITRIFASLISGISFGWFVFIIMAAITFFAAPKLFGVVLLTGGAMLTVQIYAAVAFAIGFLVKFFFSRKLFGGAGKTVDGKTTARG